MAIQKEYKNYNDTYLYKPELFGPKIKEFLIKSKMINKDSKEFEDIRYEVKRRQPSNAIVKCLDSPHVILLRNDLAMPPAFKVFIAKDFKTGSNKDKVYIDCTGLIVSVDGVDTLPSRNVDIFVSYLFAAMMTRIYQVNQNILFTKPTIIQPFVDCFAKLFTYVIDYLHIGSVDKVREKTLYLSALYCQYNILGLSPNESTERRALKISKLNPREAEILNLQLPDGVDVYKDINIFITSLASVLKASDKLMTSNFVEKWMYLIGAGTMFGLELFPAFSNILTHAYIGSYLVHQKTIEKIVGRDLVEYGNAALKVGGEV